ncbi:hypothetical protein OQA88_9097 [Cercophora sp. LCS_1]
MAPDPPPIDNSQRAHPHIWSRISNYAWKLLTELSTFRQNDQKACTTEQGLVCEDALVKSNERCEPHLSSIFRSTLGIAFFGTPHRGAGLARWAELLAKSIGRIKQTNHHILEVLKSDSDTLARIQDSFHAIAKTRNTKGLPPIELTCFYEELLLPGVGLVVPQYSAILPGLISIGIHNNHKDMTKPRSLEDPGFTALRGELKRWLRGVENVGRADATVIANSGPQLTSDMTLMPPRHGGNLKPKAVAPSSPETRLQIIPWNPNPNFTGRKKELDQIHSILHPSQATSQTSTHAGVCIIHGLGGLGKTQMAAQYVYKFCKDYDHYICLKADSAASLDDGFLTVARKLGLVAQDDHTKQGVAKALEWLSLTEERWLIVFDNVDRYSDLEGYWPSRNLQGSIIITTRISKLYCRASAGSYLPTGRFSPETACELLRKLLGWNDDKVSPQDEAFEDLDGLPLAIVHSAGFIYGSGCSIQEFHEIFRNRSNTRKS